MSIFSSIKRAVRASYDAAKTHDQNRRHWANADQLSADAAGSVAVRRILRSRSRYEFENNPYARGIAHTMANYVIGQGPRLQVLTDDPAKSREIERLFAQWSKAIQLPQKLRTARISQVVSGEVFLQFTQSARVAKQNVPALDIKLIESEQVATPWAVPVMGGQYVDGLVFDDAGEVAEYIVLNAHPGDNGVYEQGSHNVSAEQMIHLFRPDRPGQHRGIPELASALETFAQLRRYMQAVLSAAERAAEATLYFKTDCPPGEGAQIADEGTELGNLPAIEVRRNESVFLPEGWEPFQLKAEQPTADFGATVHQYLSEIGRVLQIPVMIVTGDASNHNYASGRLDYQAFIRMIDVERADYVELCLDRIFDEWYREATLMGIVQAGQISRQWYWPGIEHIDELKAASAATARITGGLSSIATEQARAGYDWEDQQRQQADCLGIPLEEYRRRLADKILGPDTKGATAPDTNTGSANETQPTQPA